MEIESRLQALEQNALLAGIANKKVLTTQETAIYLGWSLAYLYKKTAEKEIPHYCPMGKMLYFDREELEEWLKRNRVASCGLRFYITSSLNPESTSAEVAFLFTIFLFLSFVNSEKECIFASTVSATLPVEQRTRAELLLLYAQPPWKQQPASHRWHRREQRIPRRQI